MLSLCGIQVIYIIFEGPLFFPEIRQGNGLLSFSEFYNRISLLYKILESESYWLKDSKIATFCCSSLPFTEVRNMLYQLVLAWDLYFVWQHYVQGSYLTPARTLRDVRVILDFKLSRKKAFRIDPFSQLKNVQTVWFKGRSFHGTQERQLRELKIS